MRILLQTFGNNKYMVKVRLKTSTVRRLLAEKSMSQNWLAYRLRISSGYMSQLLNGTRRPSPEIRRRFLAVLSEHTFNDLFKIEASRDGREKRGG